MGSIRTLAAVGLFAARLLVSPQAEAQQAAPAAALEPRRTLLRNAIAEYVRRENLGEIFGGFSAVLGVGGVGLAVAVWDHDPPVAATWGAGLGLSSAAVATSLFASRDVRGDVLTSAMYWNSGVFALGLAVADDPFIPRLTLAAMAGASFGSGALRAVNMLSRRTPVSTLRADLRRLDARGRGAISEPELARLERHLLGVEAPIAPWLVAAPQLVGSAVALVPAFDSAHSDEDRKYAGLLGGLGFFSGVLLLATPDVATQYRARTGSPLLALELGPGNVSMRHRF